MTEHTDIIFEDSIRVNAYDCDFNGCWKPAAFFQHMSESANLHAAKLGVGYDEMIQHGLTWVQARMKIKFLRFPRIGEQIIIRTWPKTIQQKLFFIRDFELVNLAGEMLAQATSAWLVIDTESRRLVPPRTISLTLPGLESRHGLDEPLEKIDLIPGGEEHLQARVGYSSVDIVGHTNNSRYVEWICDAFPFDTYQQQRLDCLQINYIHEVLPGEEVSIRVNQLDGTETCGVQGFNLSNQTIAFESMLKWVERDPRG